MSEENTGQTGPHDSNRKEEPPHDENWREREERLNSYITIQPGQRHGEWTVITKMDEGRFGKVYLMEREGNIEARSALRAEPNEMEGGAIKWELQVLRAINPMNNKPHIPAVFHSEEREKFTYMIMTLLGENFKALRSKMDKGDGEWPTLSVSTWIRLGIQAMYAIKVVHDNGYLHRDIKPNNFAIGHPTDKERSRLVFILDFGLSRPYAFNKNGKWISRLARATAEFRGTARYCSPFVHSNMEQGRRDDIWSLFFMLIEAHCGLPWQEVRDKQKIAHIKCNISDEELMKHMPRELRGVISSLRQLDCYMRPDYSAIYNALLTVMKRYKVNYDDLYDWEKDSDLIVHKTSAPPLWYNAEEFFNSDPIGIACGPSSIEKNTSQVTEGGQKIELEINIKIEII